jgi:hypothetical protein
MARSTSRLISCIDDSHSIGRGGGGEDSVSRTYESAYRGYLIDHHSPAPPVVDFTGLDPEEYRAFFRTADVTTVMMYCKDHWGYSYYDTQVGTRHPGLRRDWVGDIATVLRDERIEFNAYYCLEYDTLAPRQHPEWAIVDASGSPVGLTGRMAKWGMVCYETGYREYVLGQLQEIVRSYTPDSLFLDIFGKSLCYCAECRSRFQREFGYDLPEPAGDRPDEYASFDFGPRGLDVNSFLEDSASRMLDDILRTVKGIDPTLAVTINFAALYPKSIRDRLDYQFTEPWAGNWLSAAYSRDTARGQAPQLGPGDVSEVYNYRAQDVYSLAAAQIAAGGCRVFFYSGSQHTDGTLEHEEANRIGAAYETVALMEPYLSDRDLISDVAIIQSDSSVRSMAGHSVVANAIGRCKQPDPHREAVLGAMRCCDSANLAWTILPEQDASAERLREFRLVILAGLYSLRDDLARALRGFVESGGALIADGACGLLGQDGSRLGSFPLSDVIGCTFERTLDDYAAADWGGYVAPDRRVAPDRPAIDPEALWANTPDTFVPAGRSQVAVRISSGRSRGWIVPPVVELSETTWVNWWNPPPAPRHAHDQPAIVSSQYGDGRSLYFAYDFFRGRASGTFLSQGIFDGAMAELLPDPTIGLKNELHESVSFAAYARKDTVLVHVLSHLAERTSGEAPPVSPGILRLRADLYRVGSIRLIAGSTEPRELTRSPEISSALVGAYYEIALPPVRVHYLIVITTREDRTEDV